MIRVENVVGIVEGISLGTFGLLALRRWRVRGGNLIEGIGLRWDLRSPVDLAAGFAIGALVMASIYVCESASGNITHTAAAKVADLAFWRETRTVLFNVAVEEITYRGLLVSGLAIALAGRTNGAVFAAALLTGLAHLTNPAASATSVLGNTLGGLVYGYAYVLTGRLWLPIGIHFAWNLVQGPLLGFLVSGRDMGGLQHIHDLGPSWLTGGPYGPEAGLIGIAFRFMAVALVLVYATSNHCRRGRDEFAERIRFRTSSSAIATN
jgi:hypothetical protein